MTGEIALEYIRRVTAAKCFLGVSGLSASYGLTSATAPEPAVNELMMERSRERIIVADSSKIGYEASFLFGATNEVDLLITDSGATDGQVELLRQHGLRGIVRVDPVLSASD